MEIKRFGDKFIVELCKTKFELYWNRKFRFGENFIQRFCERIKVSELVALEEAVAITNKLVETKAKPTEEESRKIQNMLGMVSRIIFVQVYSYFKRVPVEDLKEFIDACYPLTYKTAQKQLKKFYNERFKGIECELEKQINEASCVEDWIVTRQMISRFVGNDITELFRFAILNKGQAIIHEVLNNNAKSQLDFNSFFIQLFKSTPYFSDLDKRNMSPDLQMSYIVKIVGIYKEIRQFESLKESDFQKLVNQEEFIKIQTLISENRNLAASEQQDETAILIGEFLDIIWLSARQHINMLKTEAEIKRMGDLIELSEAMYRALPRRRLTDNTKVYRKTNEERRNTVLGFFAYWDAHMPDDLAIIKEEQNLKESIERQKQKNVDKSDLEYAGKTQGQVNAGPEVMSRDIVMELKDESGNVVNESKLI